MELREYLKKRRGAAKRLAKAAGTSAHYVRLMAYGVRHPSPFMAIRLEKASDGELCAKTLCPDFPWDDAEQPRPQTEHREAAA